MDDAITSLRNFLNNFYKPLVDDAMGKDEDIVEWFGTNHWNSANLTELCEELHQIIYDYGRDELIEIVKLFMDISGMEFVNEVFEVFSKTEEHSH